MKVPGAERAIVDPSKIRDYLLSSTHPVGAFKAAYFRSLGYAASAWPKLAEDLRRHVCDHEAVAGAANQYGQKYEVLGKLTGPAGHSDTVVTVWIVLRGEDFPRFVTAFPGTKA